METVVFLQGFASPVVDAIARLISDLGSQEAYIVLLLTIYLAVDARIGQRLGIYLLISVYLNFHLKELFGTPRPFELEPSLDRSTEGALGRGFPSGHAQASTTFWGYLAARLGRTWLWLVAIAVVLLVSLSRLYLGVHFPIDVLGGVLIGAALVLVALAIDRVTTRLRYVPLWVVLLLGLGVPLALNLWLPPPGQEASLLTGALAAFVTAPLFVSHRPPKELWKRVALVLLGVLVAFGVLILSSLLLPDAIKRDPLWGFVRYLVLGYAGLVGAPLAGRALRLAPQPGGRARARARG